MIRVLCFVGWMRVMKPGEPWQPWQPWTEVCRSDTARVCWQKLGMMPKAEKGETHQVTVLARGETPDERGA